MIKIGLFYALGRATNKICKYSVVSIKRSGCNKQTGWSKITFSTWKIDQGGKKISFSTWKKVQGGKKLQNS